MFAPLVTLVLVSLSSTEAAVRGAASSSNTNESPGRALPEVVCFKQKNKKKL